MTSPRLLAPLLVCLAGLASCNSKCNLIGSGEGCGWLIPVAIVAAPVIIPAQMIGDGLDKRRERLYQERLAEKVEAGDVLASATAVLSTDTFDALGSRQDVLFKRAVSNVLTSWDRDGTNPEPPIEQRPAIFVALLRKARWQTDPRVARRLYERALAMGQQRLFWNFVGREPPVADLAKDFVRTLLLMQARGDAGFVEDRGVVERCAIAAYQPMLRYAGFGRDGGTLCWGAYEKLFGISPSAELRAQWVDRSKAGDRAAPSPAP